MTDPTTPARGDPLDVALGRNIRIRRKSLGLSQSALASAVGLTFQQVQKYESGANRVSFSKLVEISKALNCRIAYLIEGLEDGEAPGPVLEGENDLLSTTGAVELLQLYAKINGPRLRRALISVSLALSSSTEPDTGPDSASGHAGAGAYDQPGGRRPLPSPNRPTDVISGSRCLIPRTDPGSDTSC
eukprot:gene17418-17609_t